MTCELCRGYRLQSDCPACYVDNTLEISDVVDDLVLAITSGEVEHTDELGDLVIPAAKDLVNDEESLDTVLDMLWDELKTRDEYKTLDDN